MLKVKNKLIKSIAIIGVFLPVTIILNYLVTFLTFPIVGRIDFSHLPTLILAVTGHPWLAFINGFAGDIIGTMLRGFVPWVQISIGRGLQGLIAGYMSIWWIKTLNKKIDWKFVLFIFILLFFVIEFISYAEAFRFWIQRTIKASALIYFPARTIKTIVILPIWYYIMTYFGNKKN